MADNSNEKKQCSNCKQHIDAVNFVMHEVHCRRNIVLCPQCREPVPRVKLDEHNEEEHKLTSCSICQGMFERNKLQEHMENCPKRLCPCVYCAIECPRDELQSHLDYCGTRTEQCIRCKKYIMHKDLLEHENNLCSPEQEKGDNLQIASQLRQNTNRQTNTSKTTNEEPKISCENCGEKYPFSVLLQHEQECGGVVQPLHENNLNNLQLNDLNIDQDFQQLLLNSASNHVTGASSAHNQASNWDEYALEDSLLPCEFCTEIFPEDILFQHQSVCRDNPYKTPRVQTPAAPRNSRSHLSQFTENRLFLPPVPNSSVKIGKKPNNLTTKTNSSQNPTNVSQMPKAINSTKERNGAGLYNGNLATRSPRNVFMKPKPLVTTPSKVAKQGGASSHRTGLDRTRFLRSDHNPQYRTNGKPQRDHEKGSFKHT